jgi:hypothetical protein
MPPKNEIAQRLRAIRERMSSRGLDLLLIYSTECPITRAFREIE